MLSPTMAAALATTTRQTRLSRCVETVIARRASTSLQPRGREPGGSRQVPDIVHGNSPHSRLIRHSRQTGDCPALDPITSERPCRGSSSRRSQYYQLELSGADARHQSALPAERKSAMILARQRNQTSLVHPARRLVWLAAGSMVASVGLVITGGALGPSAAVPSFPSASPWPPYFAVLHPADVLVAVLTWLAVGIGGLGLAAGLLAARRGWRPSPRRLLIGCLLAVIALLL